ncbi:hypothetical protein CEUSTIGMA_g1023.t1 [Chlamydomonas eustigma]|uniref:Protein N-terminal glutamine amidohydrolase n=1 Tax=Chlamydomonas eustigma TaxID=1157962 RepID=A0A250WSB5_9CHLO|nr:hypothetical protein CEUSTIGMA_g1023.t1 [Chlamydomonas eustigma]|eukprot:GAX73572.1 hypothetical protein CEUSTIGMA_g1023.t1 [Chlamydomonas eustigma]
MEVSVSSESSSSGSSSIEAEGSYLQPEASLYHTTPRALFIDRDSCSPFYTPGYPEENVYRLINLLHESEQVDSLEELTVAFIRSPKKETYLWSQIRHMPQHASTGQVFCDYHCILIQRAMRDRLINSANDLDDDEDHPPSSLPASSNRMIQKLSTFGEANENGLRGPASMAYVWDLESSLAFPTRLAAYAEHVLRVRHVALMGPWLQRLYRLVPAALYLKYFASDRRHHPRRVDGMWESSAAPNSPPITTEDGCVSTMHRYLSLHSSVPFDMRSEKELNLGEKLRMENERRFGELVDERKFLAGFGVKITEYNLSSLS